jgi:hypothetical protein
MGKPDFAKGQRVKRAVGPLVTLAGNNEFAGMPFGRDCGATEADGMHTAEKGAVSISPKT